MARSYHYQLTKYHALAKSCKVCVCFNFYDYEHSLERSMKRFNKRQCADRTVDFTEPREIMHKHHRDRTTDEYYHHQRA